VRSFFFIFNGLRVKYLEIRTLEVSSLETKCKTTIAGIRIGNPRHPDSEDLIVPSRWFPIHHRIRRRARPNTRIAWPHPLESALQQLGGSGILRRGLPLHK